MAKAESLLLQKVRTERSIGIGSRNAESLHKGQLRAACSWFVAACPRRLRIVKGLDLLTKSAGAAASHARTRRAVLTALSAIERDRGMRNLGL